MITNTYEERNLIRQKTLNEATMQFVAYFIGLGDDLQTAENKVSQLSNEVASFIYPFILGNTQRLKDEINASSLPFMDQGAKDAIIGFLTPQNAK